VLAISDAHFYPAPVAMMMTDFTQVQASVFQVARAPGKKVVYLGCLLLIIGIFAMLYVRERRLWVWLTPDGTASEGTPRPPRWPFRSIARPWTATANSSISSTSCSHWTKNQRRHHEHHDPHAQ
jgi:hypothetical protein